MPSAVTFEVGIRILSSIIGPPGSQLLSRCRVQALPGRGLCPACEGGLSRNPRSTFYQGSAEPKPRPSGECSVPESLHGVPSRVLNVQAFVTLAPRSNLAVPLYSPAATGVPLQTGLRLF